LEYCQGKSVENASENIRLISIKNESFGFQVQVLELGENKLHK
jgi:hypothetical protein